MNWKRLLLVPVLVVVVLLLVVGWLGRSILWRALFASSDPQATVIVPAEGETVETPAITPRVDFSGKWELDLKASESLEEILKACGIGLAERWILDNAPISQIVTQTPTEITVDITSGPYHRLDVMLPGGPRIKAEDPAGRPVESTTVWNDEGTALVTKVWLHNDEPPWVMTRTISDDGDTTTVLNEYSTPEGKPISCQRIYRRVKD